MKPRAGVALLIAVFVLVVMEAMTIGVCALSLQTQKVAHARARMMRARVLAEERLAGVVSSWSTLQADSLPVGAVVTVGLNTSIERTGAASFLIATTVDGQRRVAVARLLDRQRAIDETVWRISPDTSIALGGVRWSEVASIADSVEAGTAALIYSAGDMVLGPGPHHGILVVEGSLTMVGTQFDGVAVARGRIDLLAGAIISGAARSRDFGGYSIPGVLTSDSIVRAVLLETPSAARLILQQRRYIPGF